MYQKSHHTISLNKIFYAMLIFMAAYMTTIRVQAQETYTSGDTIQLKENKDTVITGSVSEVDDNFLIIDSAGKKMKIDLSKVDMKASAKDILRPGMSVTVQGEIKGDDFGMPIVKATDVTASEGSSITTVYDR